MLFRNHFGETVTVVLAIVMGLIMSLASIVVDRLAINYSNVFKIWAMITFIILMVSIFIPYKSWSSKIMQQTMNLRKESVIYKLLDNILPSLILNTFNTVLVSAANILYNESIPAELQMSEWIHGILHDWPIMFVISYLGAFVAEAAGVWVAKKYTEL